MSCSRRFVLTNNPSWVSSLARLGPWTQSRTCTTGSTYIVHFHFALTDTLRRYFGSIPNSQDPRMSPWRASLGSQQSVLVGEANRLLLQSDKHHQHCKSRIVARNDTSKLNGASEDDFIRQEVLKTANELIALSVSMQLECASGKSQDRLQTGTVVVHRAFLTVTNNCMDCIFLAQGTTYSGHAQTLLSCALALMRQAQSLGLPFHIPLIQRLMEVTASMPKTDEDDQTVAFVLEIASFTNILNAAVPLTAIFFRPALLALIRTKRFTDAVMLLYGMRDQHGLVLLDRHTTTDLYREIHAVVKGSFATRQQNRRQLPESPVTEIVATLEPSVLAFAGDWVRAKEERIKQVLDSISDYEMEEMAVAALEGKNDEDEADGFDSDDDDSDSTDYYKNLVMFAARKFDPLDQVVNAIIAKGVKSDKAKAIFSDMVHTVNNHGKIPQFITVTTNLTREENDGLDVWSNDDECESDSESDSDNDDDKSTDEERQCLSDRFPDITAQFVQLNSGLGLKFSKSYIDLLWISTRSQRSQPDLEMDKDDSDDDDDYQ